MRITPGYFTLLMSQILHDAGGTSTTVGWFIHPVTGKLPAFTLAVSIRNINISEMLPVFVTRLYLTPGWSKRRYETTLASYIDHVYHVICLVL
jgi:hypothetical protein